jgi:hypothetical protein
MTQMKPIRFSNHSKLQMLLRGATEQEVENTIRGANPTEAKMNRLKAKKQFAFGDFSPLNHKHYNYKTIEAVFADEPVEIVIVTVKVYYSNEEAN